MAQQWTGDDNTTSKADTMLEHDYPRLGVYKTENGFLSTKV